MKILGENNGWAGIVLLFIITINALFAVELKIESNFETVNLGSVEAGNELIVSPGIFVKVVSTESRWSLLVDAPSDFRSDDGKTVPIERLSICTNDTSCIRLTRGSINLLQSQPQTSSTGKEIRFSYRFRPSFSDRPSKTGYNTKLIYRIIGSDIDNTYAEPDPFSPDCDGVDDETTIFFYMENEDTVSVFVFDANGTKMRTIAENLACKQGMNRLVWDGKDDSGNIVPDGDYEYRIKTIKTKTLSGTVKVLTLRRTKPYASPLQNPSSLGESNIYTISKSSSSRSIYRGEVVIYTIKIKSVGGTGFTGFVLYDIPDEGIYYIKGTSYLNGSKLDEPSFTGNKFIWAKNFNNPVDSAFIEYKAFVALDCPVGTRKNTAFAQVISTNGQYETDEVSSVITVIGGGFTKSSIIFGKIFEDKNGNGVQDDDEKGVKNACVTLDNGEKVITDEYGRFSFPYVKSANHIVLVNDASSSIGFEHASKTINISESGIYHLSIPVKPVGNKQNKAKTTMIFALNNKYDLDQKKLLSELRFYGERDFSSGWKLTISFDTSATGKEGFVDDYRLPAPNLGDNSMLQRRGKSNLIFSFAKGESYIKYGYGALGFNDGSELTAWNTTQEGLETLLRTRYLDIKAFAARAKSERKEERFKLAYGRTSFILKEHPIFWGSEQVYIEERDSSGNIILSIRSLKRTLDYTIDYDNGILRILTPVMIPDWARSQYMLVVSYEYETNTFFTTHTNYGASGAIYLGDEFSIRSNYIVDDNGVRIGRAAGIGISFKIANTIELTSEIAQAERDDKLLSNSSGLAYSMSLGLNIKKLINIYSYSNYIGESFWLSPRIKNPLSEEIIWGRPGSILAPVAQRLVNSNGAGIIAKSGKLLSFFVASKVLRRGATFYKADINSVNWAAGIGLKLNLIGDLSCAYLEEIDYGSKLERRKTRSVNILQKRTGKFESNILYSAQWGTGLSGYFEFQSEGNLKLNLNKIFMPLVYWQNYETYKDIYQNFAGGSYIILCGITSSPLNGSSLNILAGIEAKNSFQGVRQKNPILRGNATYSFKDKLTVQGSSDVKKRRAFSENHYSFKLNLNPTKSVALKMDFSGDNVVVGSFKEYDKVLRSVSFSIRPIGWEFINLFAVYNGGRSFGLSEYQTYERNFNDLVIGITLSPSHWAELGLMSELHHEKIPETSNHMFLTTANAKVNLPFKLELGGYARFFSIEEKMKPVYTTELSRRILDLLRLSFGYNFSRYNDIPMSYKDKRGKYYIELSALKAITR